MLYVSPMTHYIMVLTFHTLEIKRQKYANKVEEHPNN